MYLFITQYLSKDNYICLSYNIFNLFMLLHLIDFLRINLHGALLNSLGLAKTNCIAIGINVCV